MSRNTTISGATLALVAQRAGVSLLEAKRALLGMPCDRADVIRAELVRAGVDVSFLTALASARDPRPSRVNAATTSIRSDQTNPTKGP